MQTVHIMYSVLECPTPPISPDGSTVHNSSSPYLVGEVVSYICTEGYENITPEVVLTCLVDKTWAGLTDAPTCTLTSTLFFITIRV